jgi:hypothetical protein
LCLTCFDLIWCVSVVKVVRRCDSVRLCDCDGDC